MPDWSRRRALRTVATAGVFALAGCSGEPGSSGPVQRDRGDPVPPTDLEVLFVRDPGGEPLFDVESGSDDGTTPEGGGIEGRRTRSEYLRDPGSRDRITFRSTPAAEELRAFVDATEFGSDSVYLLERPVSACYEARLVGVYREDDGVAADLCQSFRPADIACSVDGIDTVGVGIRLPFPGDGLSGHDWSWRGDCGDQRTVASEGEKGG
jgi:hypothetical protein